MGKARAEARPSAVLGAGGGALLPVAAPAAGQSGRRAAGRIPVVSRIPFRADSPVDYPARLNAAVDEVTRQLGLLPGPDLHGWFQANRNHLTDGLHPDDAGSAEMIRRWAEAAAPLYP